MWDEGQCHSFAELASGPEWKRFAPIASSSRTLLADTLFGADPVLEITSHETLVLRSDLWPLYVALAWHWLLLRAGTICSVHAGVVSVGNEALVLIGASGTGKSTLCYALHSLGANFFTDEDAYFSLPYYGLYPLVKDLCLRPGGADVLALAPGLSPWYEAKPGDRKCLIPLNASAAVCPVDRVHLIFLGGFATRPKLQALAGGSAARLLFRHLSYGSPNAGNRLQVVAGLAHRYPCYELHVGNPRETAELLLERLRQTS